MSSSKNSDSTSNHKQSEKEESKQSAAQPAPVNDDNIQAPTEDAPISNEVLARWEQIRCIGKLPERRSYHTGTSYGNKVYIYGGYDIKEGDMQSMFCLDVHDFAPEWQEVRLMGDAPKGISRHSAVIWDNKIY